MSNRATVLYDAPGPRARNLYRFASLVVAALMVAIGYVIYRALDEKGQLTAAKWDPFLESTSWTTYLIPGIRGTLIAAAMSIVFALILGSAWVSADSPSTTSFGRSAASSSNCSEQYRF